MVKRMSVERYKRQSMLVQVGDSGMQRLLSAHVLVIGVGGLGCPALQYLVGAGIGKITLVDPDNVELSNLHRQILFTTDDLGQPKATSAVKRLSQLNDAVELVPVVEHVTPSNIESVCANVDIVLDCADTFAVSYSLSDYCYENDIAFISASALGFSGYVGGFCGGKPSLRAVFPELPNQAANCATAGVMGAVVGTLGTMQAQFTINTLLALSPSPLGQLMRVDLERLHQSSFRFDNAPEPDASKALHFVSIEQMNTDDFIIDLREEESDNSSINHIAIAAFNDVKPTPKTNQRAVIACRSGLRAWRGARILQTYWQGSVVIAALGNTSIQL